MRRKGKATRKGMARGMQKYKTRSNFKTEDPAQNNRVMSSTAQSIFHLGSYREAIGKGALMALNASVRLCCFFCLIPYTVDKVGKCSRSSGLRRVTHFLIVVIFACSFVHKIYGCAYRILVLGSFDILTVSSLGILNCYIVGLGLTFGALTMYEETMSLLNGYDEIYTDLSEAAEKDITVFDNPFVSIKILGSNVILYGLCFIYPPFTIFLDKAPYSILTLVTDVGLISTGNYGAPLMWKLLFFPIELINLSVPLVTSAIGTSILYLGIGNLQTYTHELSNVNVRTLAERDKVENLFVQMLIYNKLFNSWFRFVFPPLISALAIATISNFYLTLRASEDLPTIIYLHYPFTGATILGLIFWLSFDMTSVIRSSEGMIIGLRTLESGVETLSKTDKLLIARSATALRPILFSMGDYGDFSFDLPITVWDEVLNQLLFLLNL